MPYWFSWTPRWNQDGWRSCFRKPSSFSAFDSFVLIYKQGVILVAAGQTGLSAVVTSGTKTLGTQALNAGFNSFSFLGMTTGTVSVKVVSSVGASVVAGSGKIAVSPYNIRLCLMSDDLLTHSTGYEPVSILQLQLSSCWIGLSFTSSFVNWRRWGIGCLFFCIYVFLRPITFYLVRLIFKHYGH